MSIHAKIKRLLCCCVTLVLLQTPHLYGLNLVYNLKLRRAFDATSLLAKSQEKPEKISLQKVFVTALPIFYKQKRHIVIPSISKDVHEKTHLIGSLFNVRAMTSNFWWAELTTGVEKQTVTSAGTQSFKIAATGIDDIVISVGKDILFKDGAQLVVYGIAGAPFQQDVTALEAGTTLVGSRFYGLGAGSEFSYAFINKEERVLTGFLQVRLVHFFSRSWYPILAFGDYIQPGNTTDVFAVIRYREKKNVIEIGYNPTFFTNQAADLKAGKVKSPHYVRNSFYSAYEHLFDKSPLLKAPGTIGAGLNIGRINLFDTKIISCWVTLTLLF